MRRLQLLCILFLCFLTPVLYAAPNAVAGYWQTIDAKTKKPNSIIEIRKKGLFYEGIIKKTYVTPYEQRTHRCTHCTGARKGKLILGLTIIEDMRCDHGACRGGTILDPRNGNLYHATMQLIQAGSQLRVRGYIGIPLFGKSVVWNRVMEAK